VLFTRHGFKWVQCDACGMVWVNPQLDLREIQAIYEVGYSRKHSTEWTRVKKVPLRYRWLLSKTKQYGGIKAGRVLDVGCFEGHFLNFAKSQGWEVVGTEISQPAMAFAREHLGINVEYGSLEEIGFPDSYFDLVTLNDVLEHLATPRETLIEINRILKPKGILYIWVPNFDSFARFLLGSSWGAVIFPWHFQYFTPMTLRKLSNETGFRVRGFSSRGLELDIHDPYEELLSGLKRTQDAKIVRIFKRVLERSSGLILYGMSRLFGIHLGAHIEVFCQKIQG